MALPDVSCCRQSCCKWKWTKEVNMFTLKLIKKEPSGHKNWSIFSATKVDIEEDEKNPANVVIHYRELMIDSSGKTKVVTQSLTLPTENFEFYIENSHARTTFSRKG